MLIRGREGLCGSWAATPMYSVPHRPALHMVALGAVCAAEDH
jgi:hypothetical protein